MRVSNLLVRSKLSHPHHVVKTLKINARSSSSCFTQKDSLTSSIHGDDSPLKTCDTFFGGESTRFLKFPDEPDYLQLVTFREDVTRVRKNLQSFSLIGKVLVMVRCSSCCGETSSGGKSEMVSGGKSEMVRLMHQVAYDRGTIIFRCQSCLRLFLISDHLNLIKNPSDVNLNLSSLLAPLFTDSNVKVLRFDKDTVEIVPTEDAKQHESSHKVIEDMYRDNKRLYPDNDEFGFTKLVDEDVGGCLEDNFTSDTKLIDVRGSDLLERVDQTSVEHLRYEYEMLRYSELRIPGRVSEFHWIYMLQHPGRHCHLKYLRFVYATQKTRELEKERKMENRQVARTKRKKREEDGALAGQSSYGVGMNTIFRRIHRRQGVRLKCSNVANGYLFGHQILYDFGYERDMNPREVLRAAHQVSMGHSWNGVQRDAARIIYTNLAAGGDMHRELDRIKMFNGHHFIDSTSSHPVEVFDKDSLVILTPHAKEYMPDTCDGETLYVLSVLVDLGDCVPIVYANAKKLGLRTEKFPLDRYLRWGRGDKTLTLDVCHKILLTWLNTGNWVEALRHVPLRKLHCDKLHQVDQADDKVVAAGTARG